MPRVVLAAASLAVALGAAGCGGQRQAAQPTEAPPTVAVFVDGIDPPPAAEPESPVAQLVREGRDHEYAVRLDAALACYERAERLAPKDPVVLLHLGEFHRHHSGDWDRARAYFEALWNGGKAEPETRALALHGLAKMTIWSGEYERGLRMLEESVRIHPTAIAYRNLAVFWFSEQGTQQKSRAYAEQALAVDPHESYNRVFWATFLAYDGKRDEALAILRETPFDPSMHYNYAVVHAELGDLDRALDHLRRHFHEYESNDRIRAYEMEEARADYHFRRLARDERFLRLTAGGTRPAGKPRPFWLAEGG